MVGLEHPTFRMRGGDVTISPPLACKIIKAPKNVIDYQFRKWNLIIRFRSKIKVLPLDSVFSNWVNFNEKRSIVYCSTNSKSFKAIYFFFRNSEVEDFKKQVCVYFSFLEFITFFQFVVGYVFSISFPLIVLHSRQAYDAFLDSFFLRFDFRFLMFCPFPLLKGRQN